MTTLDRYVPDPGGAPREVPASGAARLSRDDDGRARLPARYEQVMAQDEEIAEKLDAERLAAEEASRTAGVAEVVAEGRGAGAG